MSPNTQTVITWSPGTPGKGRRPATDRITARADSTRIYALVTPWTSFSRT